MCCVEGYGSFDFICDSFRDPFAWNDPSFPFLLVRIGEYQKALQMYKRGDTNGADPALDRNCQAGLARMFLRMGDITRGVGLSRAALPAGTPISLGRCGTRVGPTAAGRDGGWCGLITAHSCSSMTTERQQLTRKPTVLLSPPVVVGQLLTCSPLTSPPLLSPEIAMRLDSPQLARDCAALLENIKQYDDAAALYEKSAPRTLCRHRR